MDLIADRGRRVTVEELNTSQLLAHARKQAVQRKLDDMLIVDVDAHHYENEHFGEILPFMENDVLTPARACRAAPRAGRGSLHAAGRSATRTWAAASRAIRCAAPKRPTTAASIRDVQLGHRWMDAMSVDYSCLFPTGMLNIGLHPQKEMEVELCWAYNRWLTEKVLPESDGRFYLDALPAVLRSRRVRCARSRPSATASTSAASWSPPCATPARCNDNALHEGLSRDRGARPGAVVPLRPELGRADLQELQPLPLGACARLHLVQHPPPDQLGHQRHGRALPEAAGDLDRIRPRLGAVPDAAARPRIHAARRRNARC